MSGTQKPTASKPGRKVVRFPERLTVAVPAGTLAGIERAADFDRMAPAEWTRRMVRRALEVSRKRRAKTAGGAK